jgi:hypothetical protein
MKRSVRYLSLPLALLWVSCVAAGEAGGAKSGQSPSIRLNTSQKTIQLVNNGIGLRINWDGYCWIDSLWIATKPVVAAGGGAYSGVRVGTSWYATRKLLGTSRVAAGAKSLRITNIRYSCGQMTLDET